MKAKHPALKRLLALIMGLALVLPSFSALVGRDGSAEAIVSLPNVESIKTSGGAFKILEIVPDATQGSLGYYIDGQEPGGDWQVNAAAIPDKVKREAFVTGFFKNLTDKGLLGTDDKAPLKGSPSYTEYYPWNTALPSGYSTLTLDREETATVNGSFANTGTDQDKNVFTETTTFALAKGGTPATHVQKIINFDYYESTAEIPGSFWYSAPTFEKVKAIEAVENGTSVYSAKDSTGPFAYAGIAGVSVEILAPGESYYTIKDLEKTEFTVSDKWSEKTPYAAVSDGFVLPASDQTPYFYSNSTDYTYVGSGGTHYFTPKAGGSTHTVHYKTVAYTGGFTNNDWFLRHVFDWSNLTNTDGSYIEPRPTKTLLVSTKAANTVTMDDVQGASLIVLSGGFKLAGTGTGFTKENDISSTISAAIADACATTATVRGKPVIVDQRLFGGNLGINRLVKSLTNKGGDFVAKNVYAIKASLAGGQFNANIGNFDAHGGTNDPYYQVYDGIKTLNFYRETVTHETKLPEIISIATSIREILNYSGGLGTAKTTINVLDLQPGKGSDISKGDISKLLGVTDDMITLTTMSTAEFIGKIDDVSEKYDMVYIGASTKGVGSGRDANGFPTYNDADMTGLIYSNIGDTVLSGQEYSSSGLLERDYSNRGLVTESEPSRTFRYSGNDITKVAMEKLNSFVAAGYPVVVADALEGNESVNVSFSGDAVDGSGQQSYLGALWSSFSYSVNIAANPITNTLTSSITSKTNNVTITEATFTWYVSTDGGKTFAPIEPGTVGTSSTSPTLSAYPDGARFKCLVTPTKVLSVGTGRYVRNATPAQTQTATITISNKGNINPFRVDNCSYMYEFLSTNFIKKNVMSIKDPTKTANLKSYVDIAKPEILFSNDANNKPMYPTVYSNDNGNIKSLTPVDGACTLDYTFRVVGPDTSTYTCNLYLDGNGDGRYKEEEKLSDVFIREKNNGIVGNIIDASALKSGQEYFVTTRLPLSQVGIVPWKLEIVKPTKDDPTKILSRTSFRSYSHVASPKGERQKINILQINTSRPSEENGINLSDQMLPVKNSAYKDNDGICYKGIYGKLFADVQDFEVIITTIRASEVEAMAKAAGKTTINDYFNDYNMLVIGFDDAYQGLSLDATKAIVKYQTDPSHAILFTHDTTSFYFVEGNTPKTEKDNFLYAQHTGYVGGYYFNMLARPIVGLDVYGVSDPEYGFTVWTPPEMLPSLKNHLVATEKYSKLTAPTETAALLNKDYSIAYKPRSGTRDEKGNLTAFKTVPETQGLTKGVLLRYYKGGGKPTPDDYDYINAKDPFERTTTIAQINEGQITSYPYDINTVAFKSGGKPNENKMTVAETHFQYQQLNMNSDDIVVWFTLAGKKMDNYPNDVSNSYYIYNKGNVTYSGAGHTTKLTEVNKNVEEAKLFVNTMIAAYRVTNIKPEARFTDKTGTADISTFLVPADGGTVLSADNKTNTFNDNRKIYFSVYDSFKSETKVLSANLKWKKLGDNDESIINQPAIYDAQTNQKVELSLASGKTYYIKLDDVLTDTGIQKALAAGDVQLLMSAARTVGTGAPVSSIAADLLSLRKLDLFSLS